MMLKDELQAKDYAGKGWAGRNKGEQEEGVG